jgi:predicted metal-dependent phosphoesterase TrpH
MHLHTSRSFDCLSDPERVIEAADQRGITRICVTDHNEIASALVLKERYPDRVIVGEEVKTEERVDVIGLYIEEAIPKGTPARRTCDLIHEQGGLVYMPHPFAGGKGGGGRLLDELADVIDVVEVFNARLHRAELNQQALAWAQAHRLPGGAGSDAHTLGEIGRAYVELPAFRDTPAGFLQALRSATVQGATTPRLAHLASTYAKVHKVFFRGRT